MIFQYSAEVFVDASEGLRRVWSAVEVYLKNAVAASPSLSALPVTIRYVPIAMPEITRARYPERSKLRKKERLYDCAPQLDYDVFVRGTFEQQLREYLRGFALSVPYLADLGATQE
ncbi:protein of unknown function [Candidatus Filomicrobium marinum]|uniref:Uncharacterized protein n=1 Tax=Candidatus Filomicrobium marinum TaxID=1608628 RepID=A0A0D6JDX1_9HYPH|nr:hypothetical protein [Candidatus Filomicrobium marinum]CFX15620.1 protein of unknown function [Candidatus Filomicrobium marinum]CPR17991.1 protein of unknown function [Candidatus Filomicrobium marinum]